MSESRFSWVRLAVALGVFFWAGFFFAGHEAGKKAKKLMEGVVVARAFPEGYGLDTVPFGCQEEEVVSPGGYVLLLREIRQGSWHVIARIDGQSLRVKRGIFPLGEGGDNILAIRIQEEGK